MMAPEVSVVIPTRNRPQSLMQVLTDLEKQTYPLKEVIVVDSSDVAVGIQELEKKFPGLNIQCLPSKASVCIQRNLGISTATAPYIFLCDDDITLPENYVKILMEHIKNSHAGAVSGLVLQKERGEWQYEYPPATFGRLFFAFVFQQSVWGDVDKMTVQFWQQPIHWLIKRYYQHKNNSLSLAGWPLITEFQLPVFCTTVYGLGASIIKKEWLVASPYDEVLDPHGIGDNYGVAMGFPEKKAIHVVCAAKAYHHQSSENRLESATTYYRRLMALHYFLKRCDRFDLWNRLWLMWSLIGNLWLFRNKEEHKKATKKVLYMAFRNKNPYEQAKLQGKQVVEL